MLFSGWCFVFDFFGLFASLPNGVPSLAGNWSVIYGFSLVSGSRRIQPQTLDVY